MGEREFKVGDRVSWEQKWRGLNFSTSMASVIHAVTKSESEYKKRKGVVIAVNDKEIAVESTDGLSDRFSVLKRSHVRRLKPREKSVRVTREQAKSAMESAIPMAALVNREAPPGRSYLVDFDAFCRNIGLEVGEEK